MSQSLIFDHAILVVNDLKQAQQDFEKLGFTVFYGGQHADGKTENCLIVFQDNSYMELIALVEGIQPSQFDELHKVLFEPGEGWSGYALTSQNLVQDVEVMRERGLVLVGPADNSRTRPDGELVSWRAAMLSDNRTPFFLEDLTPRVLRVPDDERKIHANGVTGVARVVVCVPKIETAIEQYSRMLGEPGTSSTLTLPDTVTVDFQRPTATLTLAEPANEHSPVYGQLLRRGSSVYMMQLHTGNETKMLDEQLTHSAQIELVH